MSFELTQLGLLCAAVRFEWPGKAILRRSRQGVWIVTDWVGTRTSRHTSMESALQEARRLCEGP